MNNTQKYKYKALSRPELRRREHNFKRAQNRKSKMVPSDGEPGGLDDPNREGLNGCAVKWYLRFLKLGLEPAEARASALGPNRQEIRNQISPKNSVRTERGNEDNSQRRDSRETTRTQDFDSKEESMEDQIERNQVGLSNREKDLYMRYIDMHFDPEEARGKVMHQRIVQKQSQSSAPVNPVSNEQSQKDKVEEQPQLAESPVSNEQSEKDLEIYCEKYGLTGAERTRFIQSMQKKSQLNYVPDKRNISFRSVVASNKKQASDETTDDDEPPVEATPTPASVFCILNKIKGTGKKWFKRFIRQGYDLEGAHKKVLERKAFQRRLELSPEEQRKIYTWRKDSRPTTSSAVVYPNKMKTPLLNNPNDHDRTTQMVVLPKEYPRQRLTEADLATLENAVIEEVARGWEVNLNFKGIDFGPGMLLVDCANVETANWLVYVAPDLRAWRGVKLKACRKEDLPKPRTVSIYLPNNAGKTVSSTFEAIGSQNVGLNISAWNLLNLREHGNDQTLIISIDQRSWDIISNNQDVIRYGYGIVRVQKK